MVRHDKNSDDGIFLYDSQTHAFMPITHTGTADYNNFSITGDGERIVFASRLDPYGSLASMPTEYFYSTRTLIKYTRIIGARPDPNGVYSFAQFNSASTSTNGRRIAFLSIADLVGNSNDGNFEIFLLDLRDKACTQITDTTDKSYFGSHSRAFLNADGTHVAFRSEAKLTGNNADGNWEIIVLDVITNTLTQIADTIGSDNSGPSITADGARIAFVSTADQTGSNLYHQMAFFLADCPPASTPTPAVGPNTEALKPLKVKSGSRLATAGTGLIT